jgi:hypothetical protein
MRALARWLLRHDEVLQSFSFEKTVTGPRHDNSSAKLQLQAELERLVRRSGGQAITNLTIQAASYDSGSHSMATAWKRMAWTFGI